MNSLRKRKLETTEVDQSVVPTKQLHSLEQEKQREQNLSDSDTDDDTEGDSTTTPTVAASSTASTQHEDEDSQEDDDATLKPSEQASPAIKNKSKEVKATSSNISAHHEEDETHDDDEDDDEEYESNEKPPTVVTSDNAHVVASHYNELKECGRKERLKSRIVYMRNFNNWIKSQLISEYLGRIKETQRLGDPMRVLDMCCGKGGDLLKWERANISHLICTDIAEVSVSQCQRRYEEMMERKSKYGGKFTANFFACDSTMVRLRDLYKDKSLKLNLVSCQFSFHYSFESLTQADCMVRNAAECLQPGGYFIATIPDAYEIMRRVRASPNGMSFGNDVFNIEFVTDTNPPPLFGAKYHFHLEGVVDCPEFLVHFPTLIKLCRKHGLKLERKTTFADYYQEQLEKGRQLLQRMSGLETVYANRCGNDEQFAHLRKHVKGNQGRAYGTLSKSEWEAATIYLVCAFKKCDYTLDDKLKPVFNFD